jgi:SAM-dependent methyltransferase
VGEAAVTAAAGATTAATADAAGGALYEAVSCNLCGSSAGVVVYPARERDRAEVTDEFRSSGDAPLADPLVRCAGCGLQYVSPRLRPDVILAGYRDGADERFVSQIAARERTFARCLDHVERHAPRRGRVLDVGAAAGSFLHVARQRGWQVAGCEPNLWMCEWGRRHYGLDLHPGTVEAEHYGQNSFDVVTLWDVLEHTGDPRTFVGECRRILKPGGLLVVNYPDIGSWIARAMGPRWVFLLSVHLYYFTRQTMRALLDRAGFDVIETRPHVQRLELQYVLERAEPVARGLARIGRRLVRRAGMGAWQVPYWVGQTLVIARRRD